MKIYRVTLRRDGYEHDGYLYFSNKAQAEKEQRASNKEMNADSDDVENNGFDADEVEIIEVIPTKKGIIAALNKYGGHEDNG